MSGAQYAFKYVLRWVSACSCTLSACTCAHAHTHTHTQSIPAPCSGTTDACIFIDVLQSGKGSRHKGGASELTRRGMARLGGWQCRGSAPFPSSFPLLAMFWRCSPLRGGCQGHQGRPPPAFVFQKDSWQCSVVRFQEPPPGKSPLMGSHLLPQGSRSNPSP